MKFLNEKIKNSIITLFDNKRIWIQLKNWTARKIPIVKIDNSLKKFIKMPLFEDKIKKANETLINVGLPRLEKAK